VRPALANIITARVPEADLLIDYMTVRPQGNRAFLISDTIRRLKAADIWAKLDVLWTRAAHDEQAARLNWTNPALYTTTTVNSPTFTADRGYAGNGSSSYLTWNWIPSTNKVNYTLNAGSVFAWNRTNRANASEQLLGVTTSITGDIVMAVKWIDGNFYGSVNSTGTSTASATSDGFWANNRSSSSANEFYKNGASIATSSTASTSVPARTVVELARNNDGTIQRFSSDQCAASGAGGSLSGAQHAALYNIIQTYLRAVGAA
jgi:hypothetical protein